MVRHSKLNQAVVVLGFAAFLALLAIDTVSADTASRRLSTPLEAVQQAERYTGFAAAQGLDLQKLADSARRVTFNDSTTPFISSELGGRPAWIVPYRRVVLDRPLAREDFARWARDFDVYLDATTGQFLCAIRTDTVADTLVPPDPPADLARQQLDNGLERYHGLPPQPPIVSLREVLGKNFGITGPLSAKRITAQYLLYSGWRDSTAARPTWVIQLKGIPPTPPSFRRSGSGSPFHQLTVLRVVLDATTGQQLEANNIPRMPWDWRPGK